MWTTNLKSAIAANFSAAVSGLGPAFLQTFETAHKNEERRVRCNLTVQHTHKLTSLSSSAIVMARVTPDG